MSATRFHNTMILYLDEYRNHLLAVKSSRTATSHSSIVNEFLDFIYNKNLVGGIDQITVSMANSKFHSEYNRRKKEVISKEEMKAILKGYFVFVERKYGVRNGKLMKGLER